MEQITPQDMMALQNDYYSPTAEDAVPLFLKNIDESLLNAKEKNYLTEVKHWNFIASPDSRATTIYQAWFDSLKNVIWNDEYSKVNLPNIHSDDIRPDEQTLLEALLKDSTFKFVDDINTPEVETLNQQITKAFKLAAAGLIKEEKQDGLIWWKHKNSSVLHILKTILPFGCQGLHVGGWRNTVNAITHDHGPSWRMIVQLSTPTEAYGIYPGGESGNPGSKFYDNFIDDWAMGKYYKLWVMSENESHDKRIIGKLTFTNS
jgi:penicillin amidase